MTSSLGTRAGQARAHLYTTHTAKLTWPQCGAWSLGIPHFPPGRVGLNSPHNSVKLSHCVVRPSRALPTPPRWDQPECDAGPRAGRASLGGPAMALPCGSDTSKGGGNRFHSQHSLALIASLHCVRLWPPPPLAAAASLKNEVVKSGRHSTRRPDKVVEVEETMLCFRREMPRQPTLLLTFEARAAHRVVRARVRQGLTTLRSGVLRIESGLCEIA